MSDEPEQRIPSTFIKLDKDGNVVRTHQFEPWPGQQQELPGAEGGPRAFGFMVQLGEGGGELRHLSYDDPPAAFMSPEAYRDALAYTVEQAGSLERFVEIVTRILVKDLIEAHDCSPEDAIPAVMEFAAKVYAEFTTDQHEV
jgi:hypothetical protein